MTCLIPGGVTFRVHLLDTKLPCEGDDPNKKFLLLRFEVSDTGRGMTPDDMRTLQASWKHETPEAVTREIGSGNVLKSSKGWGLGLWICSFMVKGALGGMMGCFSDGPGLGMTFFVEVIFESDEKLGLLMIEAEKLRCVHGGLEKIYCMFYCGPNI